MSLRVSTSMPENSACSGLMYSGVPMSWAKPVKSVFSVSPPAADPTALAAPKSITLGTVDDPLLVRVLKRLADQHEQLQPILDRDAVPVAVVFDGDALDQLHHEVGS